MTNSLLPIGTVICLFALLGGILLAPTADTPKPPDAIAAAMEPFTGKMLEAAKNYERFGRVDDEFRWAILDCRPPDPARVAFSASKDEETHGRKLYSLFASDHNAYAFHGAKNVAPIGQTLVKEAWIPEVTNEPDPKAIQVKDLDLKTEDGREVQDHFLPYVQKDGKWFKASKRSALFVMMKFDPTTEGTDEGWVYGTVSGDLKQVTSIGKVASCMECHQKARLDRQFGIASGK